MKPKIIISFILILATTTLFAGKPFRIGVNAGFPNVASVNAELILPLLGGRIAPSINFSDFSLTIDDIKTDFTYFEAGLNFYLLPKGKWAYANVSYINMKTDLSFSELESDNIPGLSGGTASTDVKINSLSFKIGAKLGGTFYVRPEIGLLLSPLDDEVTIIASYPGGFTETQTEEIPSVLSSSFIFNFGFGFAF